MHVSHTESRYVEDLRRQEDTGKITANVDYVNNTGVGA